MRSDELTGQERDLGFSPQPAVRWLAPAQLLQTGIKVATSSGFIGILDKRELQATLDPTPLTVAADDEGGVWLDFVADTGDGFDATYTVASLLARPQLEVATPMTTSGRITLPRGAALVMGGDEVYPTPSAAAYDDRLRGPFRAALPAADPAPALFALPGNHDWYDGLTAFLRVFGQKRSLGGWRTEQSRSYFVVELPGRWWLVGLDTQLGTELDDPQRLFFRQHLTARLRPGDGVIVCAPAPTWMYANDPDRDPDLFNSLNWFDRTIVRTREEMPGRPPVETGAAVRLWLTGDQHHYARYSPDPGQADGGHPIAGELITCGLGGAYLAGTHRIPERLTLPPPGSRYADRDVASRYTLQARYPDAATSRRLLRGLFSLGGGGVPQRNPGFWRLAGFVHGGLFLMLAGLLGLTLGETPSDALRDAPPAAVRSLAAQALVWFLIVIGVWALQPVRHLRLPRIPRSGVLAVLLISLQLLLGFAGLVLAVLVPWPDRLPDWGLLALSLGGAAALTGWLAGYALALAILPARSGVLAEIQMSAQAIEDYKGFLRIRVDGDGTLTVFPVAVDRVCRDWKVVAAPDATAGDRRPVPVGELPVPRLIEPPVVIPRLPPGPPPADLL
jgi:hypothetical protein